MKRLDGHPWNSRKDHWATPLTENMRKRCSTSLLDELLPFARDLWRLTRHNIRYNTVRETEL